MRLLLSFSRGVDLLNTFVGKAVGWLVLIAVLVSSANATIRYLFSNSSNAWLELQWYLFSAVFLLCAGYTLLKNEHIRIDIILGRLSPPARHWIEIFGLVVFLVPLCVVMLYEGWPYFLQSYPAEQSSNAGGLLRWPVKLMILVGFVLLLAQGLSQLVKRIAILRGLIPDPYASQQQSH